MDDCVYVSVCSLMCVCGNVSAFVFACVLSQFPVCVCICMCACTCVCVCVCICLCVCMCVFELVFMTL